MELWFQTRWLVGEVAVEVMSVIDRISSLTHQIVQEAENVGNASILFKEMDMTGRSKDWAVRQNNVNSVRMKIERNRSKEMSLLSEFRLQFARIVLIPHVPCSMFWSICYQWKQQWIWLWNWIKHFCTLALFIWIRYLDVYAQKDIRLKEDRYQYWYWTIVEDMTANYW